jgi:hypothetical protein
MFAVFDNGKPASCKGFPHMKGEAKWNNNEFNTLPEAQVYAFEWLGDYSLECHLDIQLNKPFGYGDWGEDFLVIREV